MSAEQIQMALRELDRLTVRVVVTTQACVVVAGLDASELLTVASMLEAYGRPGSGDAPLAAGTPWQVRHPPLP